MASKLKLTNANGNTLSIVNSDSNTKDITINGGKITTYVDTVEDLASIGSEIGTVIVSDKDRGGIFNAIASTTANNGTIFDGNGCSWERQYSGAVNVKWFGAKGDGVTDDTIAIQNAVDYANSLYLVGSQGGGGVNLLLPSGKIVYTGITIKQGVNLIGEGQGNTLLMLSGVTSTGIKCKASSTGSFTNQVSRGVFRGFSMFSNESTPTSQIQWDIIGFSRWHTEDVFIEWFGGCTGISCIGSTLAGSGGPAQWYNTFIHVFLLNPASRPSGGIGVNLGDTDTGFEQITAMTWLGGRISAAGTGTGLSLRGTGNTFLGVTFEGLDTAVDLGSTGTRGANSNNFTGCYWEGNTTNRNLHVNANSNSFIGSFVTGGSDIIANNFNVFNEPGNYSAYQSNFASQKWEVFTANPIVTRPTFRAGNAAPCLDLINSAGTEVTLNNASATSSASSFFRLLWNNFTNVLFSFGTTEFTGGTDGLVNVGSASNRFGTVFAATGTINTSDEREKTELLDIEEAERACALELKKAIKKFKFKDSVELKGEEKSRIHFGVGAQTVKNIFESHGLNPNNYALFCYDEWEDEFETIEAVLDDKGNIVEEERIIQRQTAGNRHGIRYEELLCFIIGAM